MLSFFLLNRIVFMHANNDKHIRFRRVLCLCVHTFFNTNNVDIAFLCFCVISLFYGVFKPFICFCSSLFFCGLPIVCTRLNMHINNVKIFYRINKLQCLATSYEMANWNESPCIQFIWYILQVSMPKLMFVNFSFPQKKCEDTAYLNHYVKMKKSIGIGSHFSWAANIAFSVLNFPFSKHAKKWTKWGLTLKLCVKLHIVHDFVECIIRSFILSDRKLEQTHWKM